MIMRPIKTFCGAVLLLALLSACGSKGPLYLPKPDTNSNPPAASKDNNKPATEARQ